MTDQPAPETSTLFVPPAARNLPLAALDSATAGADMLDATARTPTGRNLLAHALVQLARDGWLRVEPGEGFEPRGGAPSAATPPQDGLSGPQDGPEVPEAGAEPRGGPSGAETGVQGRETLRQQYAAAIDEVTGGICPGDIIDAALAVHHRDTAQLRRERDMALTAADEARGLNQRITTEAARRGVISIDGIRRIGGVTDQIQEQP
ncbi:hypothetical protein [Streptomyces sp. NPDC050704]|uniref:hypothetical protein n=1 Tax=Streptomyces sp. NPDC050704 TaxID=3157219 RepID=UPI003423D3E3